MGGKNHRQFGFSSGLLSILVVFEHLRIVPHRLHAFIHSFSQSVVQSSTRRVTTKIGYLMTCKRSQKRRGRGTYASEWDKTDLSKKKRTTPKVVAGDLKEWRFWIKMGGVGVCAIGGNSGGAERRKDDRDRRREEGERRVTIYRSLATVGRALCRQDTESVYLKLFF